MASSGGARVRFLDLSPELRNDIYMYAMVEAVPINVTRPRQSIRRPALLFTCRQIRIEASPVFFGANTFQAKNVACAERFLHGLSDAQLATVLCIRVMTENKAANMRSAGHLWLHYIRSSLNALPASIGRGKMKHSAFLMPLFVNEENQVVWVSSNDVVDFKYDPADHSIKRQKEDNDQ